VRKSYWVVEGTKIDCQVSEVRSVILFDEQTVADCARVELDVCFMKGEGWKGLAGHRLG
jgi:hypothetical protein